MAPSLLSLCAVPRAVLVGLSNTVVTLFAMLMGADSNDMVPSPAREAVVMKGELTFDNDVNSNLSSVEALAVGSADDDVGKEAREPWKMASPIIMPCRTEVEVHSASTLPLSSVGYCKCMQ